MDNYSSLDDDYYIDEQGRVVFTKKYLLRRGYCCENGCRHCPYKNKLDNNNLSEENIAFKEK